MNADNQLAVLEKYPFEPAPVVGYPIAEPGHDLKVLYWDGNEVAFRGEILTNKIDWMPVDKSYGPINVNNSNQSFITTDALNLRTGPGPEFDVLWTIPQGGEVNEIARMKSDPEWVYVWYSESTKTPMIDSNNQPFIMSNHVWTGKGWVNTEFITPTPVQIKEGSVIEVIGTIKTVSMPHPGNPDNPDIVNTIIVLKQPQMISMIVPEADADVFENQTELVLFDNKNLLTGKEGEMVTLRGKITRGGGTWYYMRSITLDNIELI
jgi:hypothetical protein